MTAYTPEWVTLTRACDALLIPSGTPVTLREGEVVYITQALGGSFTVNISGNLARIDAKDADALGKTAVAVAESTPVAKAIVGDGTVSEEAVWAALRTCYDPEIPVNVVELGLIYVCTITPLETGGGRVDIQMTLTAPGCGMGPVLAVDVEQKMRALDNVMDVKVDVVFDPPWDRDRMSEAAQLQLGLL
jgi:probable FeS assembly SUF system protein SufT